VCWCYVAGLSVGDVVSECHLVGQPLFKYQDDARSNTHKIQPKFRSIETFQVLTVAPSPTATAALPYVQACRQLHHVTPIPTPSAACFTICFSFFYRMYRNRTVCPSRENFTRFAMCQKRLIMSECQSIATLFLLGFVFLNSSRNQEIGQFIFFTKKITLFNWLRLLVLKFLDYFSLIPLHEKYLRYCGASTLVGST